MTRKMKMVCTLVCAAEIISCTKMQLMKSRIEDLETQRVIYSSRVRNWTSRAVEDEAIIENLQKKLDALADGKITLEDAGTFLCTAYCTEAYAHVCGNGDGVTASGQPIQANVTVAADQAIFPYGTVLYIEGVGIRIVQDKGAGVQGYHLDVAVSGSHEDALNWEGYGMHRVWVIREVEE